MMSAVQQKECLYKTNINKLASVAIQNRTKSIALIKDVTGLIISSILYYRKIIPAELFSEKKLGTQNVKILKCNTNHNLADNFCNVLFSAFDAIDLGYLKRMTIIFLEDEKPVEIHKLYFEHTGECYKLTMIEQTCSNSKLQLKHKIENLKDQILKTMSGFIQALISIDFVPKNPSVVMDLAYFNDITPKDYQPKLFEPLDGTKEKHRLATQPIHFGHMMTPFHSIKLKSQFKSDVNEQVRGFIQTSSEIESSTVPNESVSGNSKTNPTDGSYKTNSEPNVSEILNDNNSDVNLSELPQTEINNTNDFTAVEKEKLGTALDNISIKEEPLSTPRSPHIIDEIDLTEDDPVEDMKNEGDICCPCGTLIEDGVLVRCDNCKLCQHIYCFDMLLEEHVPKVHICDQCAIKNPKLKCTVPELCKLDQNTKTGRSLLRLTLGLYYINDFKVTKELLQEKLNLFSQQADILINQLKQMNIVNNRRGASPTNMRFFQRITIPKYFSDHSIETESPLSPSLTKRRRLSVRLEKW